MSTVGPNEPPVAAAPGEPKGDAAQPVAGDARTPSGFVPVAAIQDERKNTERARQEAATYRAHMELAGWTIGEDGIPVAPPPRQEPSVPAVDPLRQLPAEFVQYAQARGEDPMELARAWGSLFGMMATPVISSVTQGNADLYKDLYRQRDQDFDLYEKSIDKYLGYAPPYLRGTADAMKLAIKGAREEHVEEIIKRGIERGKNPGKAVGRWTEGAAPGNQAEPPPDSFSEETLEIARRWGVPQEQLDRAAANREVSRRRR